MNTFMSNKISSFGNNFIKVANKKYYNNVLLSSSGEIREINDIIPNIQNITPEALQNILQSNINTKDILLIGCGNTCSIPLKFIKDIAHLEGYSLEWMITKSAIHVYNLLIEEYRHVLALMFWI